MTHNIKVSPTSRSDTTNNDHPVDRARVTLTGPLSSHTLGQFKSEMYDYAAAVSDWSGASYMEEAGLSSLTNALNCSRAFGADCGTLDNDTWLQGLTNGSGFNSSMGGNFTSPDENLSEVIVMAITSVILALIILITIIGNVFVIAAIILERNLQNVANYLVASLAVADLMVACLVMPLGAVYEISKGWILGAELCDMWTSSDVLCCTASILHLVAIATDRYWAVTNVDYIHTRNERRIFTMIVLVWSVALIVSLAPQFGWKDPDYLDRITLQQRCLVSQDVSYQIFATCSTFYVPLLVILVLYWKIFQTARKRIRRRREHQTDNSKKAVTQPDADSQSNCDKHSAVKKKFLNLKKYGKKTRSARTAETLAASLLLTEGQSTTTVDTVDDLHDSQARQEQKTTAFTISEKVATSTNLTCNNSQNIPLVVGSTNVSPEKSSATTTNNGSNSHQSHMSDISRIEILQKNQGIAIAIVTERNVPAEHPVPTAREKKETLEAKRERKAAKTLAIITGAFVVCWLPFFIMALVMPICQGCVINDYMASFFLWLGYFNSTLNPVIYTIFSPDFRQAFARILFGRHRRRRPKKY